METLIATLSIFAACMLLMGVGAMVSGRRLKGSCGGTGEGCSCDEAARAECALAKHRRDG
jgi:hypothetical protein